MYYNVKIKLDKKVEENIKQKIILETTVSEKKKLVKDLKEKEIEKP